jgi:N-acetyl-gamma-glutamyl-phosphate reductase
VPKHRHLSEIEQELSIAAGEKVTMSFTPHLIPAHNGICSTTSAKFIGNETDLANIDDILKDAYGNSYFVRLLGKGKPADTKNVTRTNHIDIGWDYDSRTGRLLLLSAEDNLGKGAGGQAIQCFNIMFGLDETTGLKNY